jgi:hypothetical protein
MDAGTRVVLSSIGRSGSRCYNAENSESRACWAGLSRPEPIGRAELWRWCSLWSRGHSEDEIKALLSRWPVGWPTNWAARVNAPLTAKEQDRVRLSI